MEGAVTPRLTTFTLPARPASARALSAIFAYGRRLGVAEHHAKITSAEILHSPDVLGIAPGYGQHGNVLDEIASCGDVFFYGLQFFRSAGNEEVAFPGGVDLRLYLTGVGVGDFHVHLRVFGEGGGYFPERFCHACPAIDVQGSGGLRRAGQRKNEDGRNTEEEGKSFMGFSMPRKGRDSGVAHIRKHQNHDAERFRAWNKRSVFFPTPKAYGRRPRFQNHPDEQKTQVGTAWQSCSRTDSKTYF